MQDSLLEQAKEQARDKEGEKVGLVALGKAKSFLDPHVAGTAAPARPAIGLV